MIVFSVILLALSATLYGVLSFFNVPYRLPIAAGAFAISLALVVVFVMVAMDRPPAGAVPIARYEDEAG